MGKVIGNSPLGFSRAKSVVKKMEKVPAKGVRRTRNTKSIKGPTTRSRAGGTRARVVKARNTSWSK